MVLCSLLSRHCKLIGINPQKSLQSTKMKNNLHIFLFPGIHFAMTYTPKRAETFNPDWKLYLVLCFRDTANSLESIRKNHWEDRHVLLDMSRNPGPIQDRSRETSPYCKDMFWFVDFQPDCRTTCFPLFNRDLWLEILCLISEQMKSLNC